MEMQQWFHVRCYQDKDISWWEHTLIKFISFTNFKAQFLSVTYILLMNKETVH